MIAQYEKLDTPLYYEYADGWKALLEYMPSVQMLVVLLSGFLASGIFSNEFQWKADAIFFSTKYGRNKAVTSKVGAGFWLVTGIYWVSALLYSAVVLGILGTVPIVLVFYTAGYLCLPPTLYAVYRRAEAK